MVRNPRSFYVGTTSIHSTYCSYILLLDLPLVVVSYSRTRVLANGTLFSCSLIGRWATITVGIITCKTVDSWSRKVDNDIVCVVEYSKNQLRNYEQGCGT